MNDIFNQLKEVNDQATYALMRGYLNSDNQLIDHDDIKETLALSDGKAELYRAEYELAKK